MNLCCYAIFSEEANIDATTNHITVEKMFSSLKLSEPGTTQFTYLVGITGIEEGMKANIKVAIIGPNDKGYKGHWESPESTSKNRVYNAFFNCSDISFEVSGEYRFIVQSEEQNEVLSSRVLEVEIADKGLF